MEITTLENEYNIAKKTTSFAQHQKFIKLLLSSNEHEIVNHHFSLIKNRDNWNLYLRVRAAFKKRGSIAEKFLIDRIKNETDPNLQADALHLLGELNSKEAIPISRDFIKRRDPEHREKACYVLGWLGTEDDIDILGDRLLNDPDADIRATAATALDQVRLRLPKTKRQLLINLRQALEKETDEEVTAWIIITIQYIMEKKFGLKENIEEAEWTGDVDRAKKRALRALEGIT